VGTLLQPPLAPFVKHLQGKYGLQTFVETGTYMGAGAIFAAQFFPQVATIEISPEYHAKARALLDRAANVRAVQGDSRVELPKIVAALAGPALFWLDGHAGGGHFGSEDDCPLLEELAAIAASPFEHFLLIDDARAFLAPPPPPFDAGRWPSLPQVLDAARARHPYDCVVIADTLICAPAAARADLRAFCNWARPKI
jgi:hypothetical protein